ncbi:hypothetical protein JTB14_012901 [Gonioctena quinquepunctata]|nr:hypothetical protein JTB14_012901 [Gonioctena quinquepunctata]
MTDVMELKVCCMNIMSLATHINELREFSKENSYSIICITESWLNDSILDETVSLPGYNIFRSDRINSGGGGVPIYVKQNIQSFVNDLSSNHTEQLWITITVDNTQYTIGVIYRLPKQQLTEFSEEFENILCNIEALYENIICTRDFNIDLLQHSITSQNLQNSFESFALKQCIDKPTRVQRSSSTLLDLMTYSEAIYIKCHNIMENSNILSDHFPIDMTLLVSKFTPPQQKIVIRIPKKIDVGSFNQTLMRTPFHQIYETDTIESKVVKFNDLVIGLFDKFAPEHTVKGRKKNNSPWLTENIRLMIKLRNQALQKFKKKNHMRTGTTRKS